MKNLMFVLLLTTSASPAFAQAILIDRYEPIPEEMATYVIEEDVPSVTIAEEIVIGERLPEVVVLRELPRSEYVYAVVNERRLIVEPDTRRVISIVEY